MSIRLALYALADKHHLNHAAFVRLKTLAMPELAEISTPVRKALPVAAAALAGFGIIMWLAANWDGLSRAGKFMLLEGALLACGALACWLPRVRQAGSVLLLLCVGGLLAFFGQTYQTGADPWQLFACWALLALPLLLAVRGDMLWTLWVLVAATAIALWLYSQVDGRWQAGNDHLGVHLLAWSLMWGLALLLSPRGWRRSGAGICAARLALTLASVLLMASALDDLFDHRAVGVDAVYLAGLLLLAAVLALYGTRRFFELYAVCVLALVLNVLLIGGLIRLLIKADWNSFTGSMLLVGLAAAGLMSVTVKAVLALSRRDAGETPTEATHGTR